jgi:SAM-dependent methyltransferase
MNDKLNDGLRNNLREAYNKFAQERDSGEMQAWKIRERADFLALLKREHKKSLLEIGAGTGRDGKFFQERGLEVVCVDLSPAMVSLCKQKDLNALVMDFADLQFPDDSFDAVYAMNSLLHLPKAEFPAVLQKIEALLKTGGVAFLGMYGGYDHEGVWEKDFYTPKRFFSFFTDEDLEQAVSKVFNIHSFNRISFEENNPVHFQSLVLKKRAAG